MCTCSIVGSAYTLDDLHKWHVQEALYADLRGSAAALLSLYQLTMATANKDQKAKVGYICPRNLYLLTIDSPVPSAPFLRGPPPEPWRSVSASTPLPTIS